MVGYRGAASRSVAGDDRIVSYRGVTWCNVARPGRMVGYRSAASGSVAGDGDIVICRGAAFCKVAAAWPYRGDGGLWPAPRGATATAAPLPSLSQGRWAMKNTRIFQIKTGTPPPAGDRQLSDFALRATLAATWRPSWRALYTASRAS